MITIRIETENDAFQDGNAGEEISRILNIIAKDFSVANYARSKYQDINGNNVAMVEIK